MVNAGRENLVRMIEKKIARMYKKYARLCKEEESLKKEYARLKKKYMRSCEEEESLKKKCASLEKELASLPPVVGERVCAPPSAEKVGEGETLS
jgi:septal ring factor EnvC (AmiA/AmiB activator)